MKGLEDPQVIMATLASQALQILCLLFDMYLCSALKTCTIAFPFFFLLLLVVVVAGGGGYFPESKTPKVEGQKHISTTTILVIVRGCICQPCHDHISVPCIVGCLVASLASAYWILVQSPLPPEL